MAWSDTGIYQTENEHKRARKGICTVKPIDKKPLKKRARCVFFKMHTHRAEERDYGWLPSPDRLAFKTHAQKK
jgi:hypothetical protein